MSPMHADGGNDHHGEHQRGTDRPEKAERDQKAAGKFAESGSRRKQTAGAESDRLEEAAGASDAVSAEPAEQFLCAVSSHDEPENEASKEQTFMKCHIRNFLSTSYYTIESY